MKVHGKIKVLGYDLRIKNIDLEDLSEDIVNPGAGYIWYNNTEKRVKYANSVGEVKTVVHFGDIEGMLQAVNASVAENADNTAVLQVSRSLTIVGDASGTGVLKSGEDTLVEVTLPATGVVAAAYGTNKKIAAFKVNAKGLVTEATNLTYMPNVLDVQGGLGWRDITADLVSKGGSDSPALAPFQGLFNAYKFSQSKLNHLYSTFHIPHDYALGTAVFFHLHWSDSSAVPSGNVRWGFEYTMAKGHGQQAFPLTQTVYIEQACVAQYSHMIAEISTGIVSASLEPDAMILVRVFRDTGHALDTSPAGVFAFTCDIHYQSDRFATLNRTPNFYA